MYLAVKEVKPFPNYTLLLTFKNNEKRILDMSPYLEKGKFKELKNPVLFNTVRVSFDTIEWANEADLCPEFLYTESRPYEN